MRIRRNTDLLTHILDPAFSLSLRLTVFYRFLLEFLLASFDKAALEVPH